MVTVISGIMKYVMPVLMIVYMTGSFTILRKKSEEAMKWAFVRQFILVLLFHACGYSVLFVYAKSFEMLALYAAEVLFLILYAFIFRNLYSRSSRNLLSHTLMFLVLGFIILARLSFDKALKQFLLVLVAATMTLIVPKMFSKAREANVFSVILGFLGLFLLGIVLIFSKKTYGANLSLNLGFFSFQPSEFVKISFVLLIAVLFKNKNDLKIVLLTAFFAMLHVLLLVASTDLGGALIYAFSYLFMVYVATGRLFYLFGGLFLGCGASVIAYELFSHVRTRVQIWLDPWPLFSGKGSQVCNSLLGIASGGFFGTGLFGGDPRLIPIVEKDYVFSAVCEEMGGIIGICIILICLSCLLSFLKISGTLHTTYYRTLGVGLSSIYGIQVFLSIGGNIKLIPATGVTLPFVSYGGSSVFSTFILFSLIQELYVRNGGKEERISEIEESRRKQQETEKTAGE